ncbi:hypothetical protein CORT_0A11330 [Candida orthopsilosis Co 90-125]|uniref:Uncharacterized protein n=1 Tax=Candida orthopsilosis (strain 90-125) TaxID=1136231 RepID=H8WXL2_CANO9|nr:hypothetical protein CORT_0A11330 [Candida orthopsilosis Co 90-125]CCG21518.1 hypothetical protein CORT_0A11330 [Candida orthopsilosis Co 90-125]
MAGHPASHLVSPPPSTSPRGRHINYTPKSNSQSPIREKYGHNISGKGNFPTMDEDDLRSIISSPNLTPDQLRSISKSPLARRMHVVASNPSNDRYVIPIPLTLRLPPRLSSPQAPPNDQCSGSPLPSSVYSPTKSKRQTLVYTSHGYEKIDVSSASEDEQEEVAPPPVPEKPSLAKKAQPPSVATNKTKYSKLAFPNKEPDELSMIEEMSNFGSRNSSIARIASNKLKHELGKRLPNLPTEMEVLELKNEGLSPHDAYQAYKTSAKVKEERGQKETPIHVPSNDKRPEVNATDTFSQVPVSPRNIAKQSHNRRFSETSQVSSVSSFSSAGAFELANYGYKAGPHGRLAFAKSGDQNNYPRLELVDSSCKPHHIVDRKVSDASQSSMSSSNSWNSLQQSIDISLNRGSEEPQNHSFVEKNSSERADSESHWSDVSPTDSEESCDEVSPLNITRQNTSATSASMKSLVDKEVQDNNDTDFEHKGAGVAFAFPNNSRNITNNKTLKSKSVDDDTKSVKSRFSFYSNGQIEIPDLANGKVMDQYSSKTPSSYNETVFSERHTETSVSDMEQEDHDARKIRVPSRDALRHFQQQFRLYSAGDDSDNEATLKPSTLYASPTISKTAPDLQCNFSQARPKPASPIRHRRGKSMYNIDFNSSEGPQPEQFQLHQKSKSTGFNSGMKASMGPHLNKRSTAVPRNTSSYKSNTHHESKNAVPEKLNIRVAEPPETVNYAVDFKVNNTKDSDFGNNYTTPRVIDNHHAFKSRHKSVKRKSLSVCSSQKDDSDVESVVIDMTDDKYNIVTIQRSNSTISYRSVTEKHKGKEVEVILLDDDEETEGNPSESKRNEGDETDDELLSIYSKYRNDSWLFGSKSSNNSEASFDSKSQNSNQNIKSKRTEKSEKLQSLRSLTTAGRIVHELNMKRSNTTTSSNTSSTTRNRERKYPSDAPPKNPTNRVSTSYLDDKYFDYAMNGNYNFQTFMNERIN